MKAVIAALVLSGAMAAYLYWDCPRLFGWRDIVYSLAFGACVSFIVFF